MRKRETKELKELIYAFLRQQGLETPLNEHRAVAAWPEVAGPAIAKMTSDVKLRNSNLYVKVSRPSLRQDLTMQRTQLAQRINEKVGAQVIQQIVFY